VPDFPVSSQALESNNVLKSEKGLFLSLLVQVDATAPDGAYFVQLVHGTAAVIADGALPQGATFLRSPRRVEHKAGSTDYVSFDDTPNGVEFMGGLVVYLSSTQTTKTDAGAYMMVDGSVR
jgi:hypothetical protein